MMKKILAFVLTLILVLSLAACFIQVKEAGEGSDTEGEKKKDSEKTEVSDDQTVSFEELVVVDTDECLIKITDIEEDNIWGYTLKAYLENKTADKTYMFSIESAAVNGVQSDPLFAAEVAAGKKSNEDINFSDSTLKDNGVTSFSDIEISFRVYDSDDWGADDVVNVTTHVYPYGDDKATKFVRESQSTDNVIVDNEYTTVIVTGYEVDDIWGYKVNLFLLNKSDKDIMFGIDEASVNGFMADPFYATSVSAGKCAFSSVSWSDTTLEENGITNVETIEFQLSASDANDWTADDFVSETITLKP